MDTNEKISVEAGIPIPIKRAYRRESKYPLAKLNIGDSFETDDHIQGSIAYFRKTFPERRFMSRHMDNGKVRTWRIG